jgi:hypothetical protein
MRVIPYIEIISPSTFKPIQIIEPKECWFELSYYDVGEFEIYAPATQKNLECLQKGNFIHIPNMFYIWVITSIEYTFTAGGSRMISARGYECKWLLNKCIVRHNLHLPSTVSAAFVKLINTFYMPYYPTGYGYQLINIDTELSDTTATRSNLLEYLNKMTAAYGCGINAVYNSAGIDFRLWQGQDRSTTVKFSQSNDNLLTFNYLSDDTEKANTAYVVAKVNDVEYGTSYATQETDKIIIIVESSLSNKYVDDNGNEVELDLTNSSNLKTFINWLKEEGKLELAKHTTKTEITSEIDLKNSKYEFDTDYMLGDIVEVKDEFFNITTKQRIVKYTISLDSTGKISEALEFGE